MQKKAKSLLKIAAIYLGTVLGAGFASGQEHLLFFVRFSWRGIVGCLISGFLFCLLGALILHRAYDLPQKTHKAYLQMIFSRKTAAVISFLTDVFLAVTFCVMLSGAGAFFKERLHVAPLWGILLTDFLCLLVFLFNLKGLSLLNLVLTPCMLFGMIYVCLHTFFGNATSAWLPQVHPHGIFLPYAVFYVGYNLLTAAAVLVPAAALAPDKKTAAGGGTLGGFCLLLLAVLCCFALFIVPEVHGSALPMLLLSKKAGEVAYFIYSAVIFMAMLTTAVSAGFSFTQRLVSLNLGEKMAVFCVCIAAIPLSLVEFSVLIEKCYVGFGVLGVWLVTGILWEWYKNKE